MLLLSVALIATVVAGRASSSGGRRERASRSRGVSHSFGRRKAGTRSVARRDFLRKGGNERLDFIFSEAGAKHNEAEGKPRAAWLRLARKK